MANQNPRGRPALDPRAPSRVLRVRVSEKQLDRVHARADAARVPVADWIRQALDAAIVQK